MKSKNKSSKQNHTKENVEENTPPSEDHGELDIKHKDNQSQAVENSTPEEIERIKHPLEHTWSFWLQDVDNNKEWKDNLIELTTFDTVEDFWCLFHHTKLPSELKVGQDYAIFKQGIIPMWEDNANKRGGRFLFIVEKRNSHNLDRLWLDLVLLMIGQNFEDNDIINGAVVNVRVKHKISIWVKDSSNQEVNWRIEKMIKSLGIKAKLEFQGFW